MSHVQRPTIHIPLSFQGIVHIFIAENWIYGYFNKNRDFFFEPNAWFTPFKSVTKSPR